VNQSSSREVEAGVDIGDADVGQEGA